MMDSSNRAAQIERWNVLKYVDAIDKVERTIYLVRKTRAEASAINIIPGVLLLHRRLIDPNYGCRWMLHDHLSGEAPNATAVIENPR